MPLTTTASRNAKAGDRVKRLFDEPGLQRRISPDGGRWWRFAPGSRGVGERGNRPSESGTGLFKRSDTGGQ